MGIFRGGKGAGLIIGLAAGASDEMLKLEDKSVPAKPSAEGPAITHGKRQLIKGAAEFVARYRRQLHRAGMVDFDLPRGAECPGWMAVVLEILRQRPRHWHVATMRGPKGGKRYRVEWRWWSRCRAGRAP